VHADKCGLCPHFWGFSPNGGFGVWWFFPPNPALAGNASRWALMFFTTKCLDKISA